MLPHALGLLRSNVDHAVGSFSRSLLAYVLIFVFGLTAYVFGIIAVTMALVRTEGMLMAAIIVCGGTALAALLVLVWLKLAEARARRRRMIERSMALQAAEASALSALTPRLPRLLGASPIASTVIAGCLAYALTRQWRRRRD